MAFIAHKTNKTIMNYQETIDYLFHSTPVFEKTGASAYKPGLQTTHLLDAHFGHPHTCYKTIHVAGTNGKGSCSHTLASILQADGYKVGLYTSPHLVDFRERIRINGEMIPEEYVVDFVEKERTFFEPLHCSFFELTTALAFKYFADKRVDIAVIEVGLGGRLDCTNIITPLLSVITNISMDHTQFLGNTPALIAAEKAGIIKPHVPVVVGEYTAETRPVFTARAQEQEATIVFAQDEENREVTSVSHDADHLIYNTRHWGTLCGDLRGAYQQANMNTILNAADILSSTGIIRDRNSVTRGVARVGQSTGLMGRWQTISHEPLVICDTGHNVAGWEYLAQQIKAQPCRTLHIVFGMVDDKDVRTVMDMLPKEASYYWTQADSKRAIPAETIGQYGRERNLHGTPYPTVSEAYNAAVKKAAKDDFIFVGGSSYVVGDFLAKSVF